MNDYQLQIAKERELRVTLEAQIQTEGTNVRAEICELLLAKEDLERLTEALVTRVVGNGSNNAGGCRTTERSMAAGAYSIMETGESLQVNNSSAQTQKRSNQEVLRSTILDLREMSEVLKELTHLIIGILTEKALIDQRLAEERELKASIDRALVKHSELTPDLLIMKISILEDQLQKLGKIISSRFNNDSQ